METSAFIEIGDNTLKASKHELRFLKAILDKLELPYILDDIGFHNTLLDLNRMKKIHNTNVGKVEKDGSISLNNRFGHGGHFDYRYLRMHQLIEFQFADLDLLTSEEYDFLGYIIYEAETIPAVSEKSLSTKNRRRI